MRILGIMPNKTADRFTPATSVPESVGRMAESLFGSRGLHCSQAVLLSICRHFETGLSEEHARALTAGFGRGIGMSGCLCGAVSGAVTALGLVLGSGDAPKPDGAIRKASAELHRRFKEARGSTCCSVLSAQSKTLTGRRYQHCPEHTGLAAHMAAEILLEQGFAPKNSSLSRKRRPRASLLGKVAGWLLP